MITVGAKSRLPTSEESERARQLHKKLKELDAMLTNFDTMLEAEANKSIYGQHYFPNPLNADGCRLTPTAVD